MDYVIIIVATYAIIRWVEPLLDTFVSYIQGLAQIEMTYKSLHLKHYEESFDVKESAIGFKDNSEEEIFEIPCVGDCENCEFSEICPQFGDYAKAKDVVCKHEEPKAKFEDETVGRIGF